MVVCRKSPEKFYRRIRNLLGSFHKIKTIDADIDVPEIEHEQQHKNHNIDMTSELEIFDFAAAVGSNLIDVLVDAWNPFGFLKGLQ